MKWDTKIILKKNPLGCRVRRCAAVLASWVLAEAPAPAADGPGVSPAAAAADPAGSVPNGAPEGMDLDAAPASTRGDGCDAGPLRARMEGFLQAMVAGMEVRNMCVCLIMLWDHGAHLGAPRLSHCLITALRPPCCPRSSAAVALQSSVRGQLLVALPRCASAAAWSHVSEAAKALFASPA